MPSHTPCLLFAYGHTREALFASPVTALLPGFARVHRGSPSCEETPGQGAVEGRLVSVDEETLQRLDNRAADLGDYVRFKATVHLLTGTLVPDVWVYQLREHSI